jgi:hypothetical protein
MVSSKEHESCCQRFRTGHFTTVARQNLTLA